LDSLLEIDDFVVHKVLIYFHLFLKVAHLTFVDQLQDPRAGIFYSLGTLLLQVEDFVSYLCLEVSIRLIMDVLALEMQLPSLAFDEIKIFEVVHHE